MDKDTGRDNGLKFSRAALVSDTLFGEQGFKLKPRLWTPGTRKLKDESQRVPSTSAKEHLPYFTSHSKHGPFVADLIDYQRLSKMRSTYVGHPTRDVINGKGVTVTEEATGFWKYVHEGVIHPSFLLHATVTGRSSSRDPNAQNVIFRGMRTPFKG